MTPIFAPDCKRRSCVLICGGPNFDDRARLVATLDGLHQERGFALLIAGGTRGAGGLAAEWAKVRRVACDVYHTDWLRLGSEAGRIRNERMLAEGRPELVVAFPGGSRTSHLMHIARDSGIEVIDATPKALLAPFARWPIVRTNWWAESFHWAFSSKAPSRTAL
ncbi:MAG TPA: DUF2493 domain-containing protein [Hyphomicrobiaceae bacterium]|nr:DUF2493 domain-containing protein [Hyphomicrobiaceae bacterium]